MRVFFPMVLLIIAAGSSRAQWEIESSHTNADLRGIHSVGGGVAWVSGTNGTVLRTDDGGKLWQSCAIPPGAEQLDFRGIQAHSARAAMVMSSGEGELSRLYKTTDGCRTWTLLFTNPDEDGFWDALLHDAKLDETFVLGDPVQGSFVLFWSRGEGQHWSKQWKGDPWKASPGQAAFAASNSLMISDAGNGLLSFVTGGSRSEILRGAHGSEAKQRVYFESSRSSLPFAAGESSGAFSVASDQGKHLVVVGGDYRHPNQREGTAAFTGDGGYHFFPAESLPGGYRSAVAYNSQHKTWITVGPNGTDMSRDGGRHWNPLGRRPQDGSGADKDWNALSLPFAVGPHGRIGRLRIE